MRTLSLSLPTPHPGQRRVIQEARRFNVLDCGRRFGKSLFGVDRIIRKPLEGYPAAWFAPNYKYLTEAWRDLKRVLRPVTARVSEQEKRLELVTRGVIEMWSLEDTDAGRSRKYAEVVIDEAAKVKNLEEAWNESIRPTLADYEGGAWLLSTPKGMNFFWKAYAWGESPDQPDWMSWKMPTTVNPYIPPSEIEEMKANLPERVYAQEILAEFLEDAGGVFRGVSACVDAGRNANEPRSRGLRYSLGVDIAKTEDFTVLSVLDQNRRQVYFERFNQISWERQLAAIERVAKAYDAEVWMDSTGVGDPPFEELRKRGLRINGFVFTNSSKESIIDGLAIDIERQSVRLMDVPQQTSELLAYQYELTPSRNVRMNAPAGMHDDCVISLALAAWAWRNDHNLETDDDAYRAFWGRG